MGGSRTPTMTQQAFERGDWQTVIDAHPLESHDPAEWLRYGVALLQTLTPGAEAGKQQQQAALAFVQAQREGASEEAVAAAQQQAVLFSLREALNQARIEPPAGLRKSTDLKTEKTSGGTKAGKTSISAAAVEGNSGVPPYHYRTAIPLRFSFLEHRDGLTILQSTHNHGYFSCLSTILWDLMTCANFGKPAGLVSAKHGMSHFKDQPGADLFDLHFKPVTKAELATLPIGKDLPIPAHHGSYNTLDHETLALFTRSYFKPSDLIAKTTESLLSKYKIDPKKLLVIYYRGTDKFIEVEPVPAATYLHEARGILALEPELRVMVQTDQRQVRDYLLYELGAKAFSLEELPVTDGIRGIHECIENDKQEFASHLLAANLVMARSRWLITGTSNVSFWTTLFRGSAEKVIQLGALSEP